MALVAMADRRLDDNYYLLIDTMDCLLMDLLGIHL